MDSDEDKIDIIENQIIERYETFRTIFTQNTQQNYLLREALEFISFLDNLKENKSEISNFKETKSKINEIRNNVVFLYHEVENNSNEEVIVNKINEIFNSIIKFPN